MKILHNKSSVVDENETYDVVLKMLTEKREYAPD